MRKRMRWIGVVMMLVGGGIAPVILIALGDPLALGGVWRITVSCAALSFGVGLIIFAIFGKRSATDRRRREEDPIRVLLTIKGFKRLEDRTLLGVLLVMSFLSCYYTLIWWEWNELKRDRQQLNRIRQESQELDRKRQQENVVAKYYLLRPRVEYSGNDVAALSLSRSWSELTDHDLVHLKGLTGLRSLALNLDSSQVTDAGLVHLKRLIDLRDLRLRGPQVTDAGLGHLQTLTKLERLHLTSTRVSDAGLVHLKGLAKLRYLNLGGTPITDTGLKHLQGLRSLEEVYLGNTKVTSEGIKKLQQALPDCEITR